MPHANFNIGIKVILFNAQSEILALGGHFNGPMAGYNDLPGGRIDDHEVGIDFSDIAKREVGEELGDITYDLEPTPTTAVSWTWDNGQPMCFIYYRAKYISGEISLSDEHIDQKWIAFTKENIEQYFTSYHKKTLFGLLK